MTDTVQVTSSASVAIDAAKLREMRQDQGLTQKDLAAKCGLGWKYVSQLETGYRTRVSPPTFVRLCDALNIAPTKRRSLRQTTRPKVAEDG